MDEDDITTIRVIIPQNIVVKITVLPEIIVGSNITPLPTRPTTLNEVITGGVTLGLWP